MLIDAVFGVAGVRKEWTNVARALQLGCLRCAFTVILAAAPPILTDMPISIGIAWLVIVARWMLVGCTGSRYFVRNEWNNLSIANVTVTVTITIILIGQPPLAALVLGVDEAIYFADRIFLMTNGQGARPHRSQPPSAVLRAAQPDPRFPGQPQLWPGRPAARRLPVARVGRAEQANPCLGQDRRARPVAGAGAPDFTSQGDTDP